MPADPAAPAAPGARSGSRWSGRDLARQLAPALGLGVLARLLSEIPAGATMLVGIDLVAAGAFLAGIFSGWFGAVAFWAGEAGLHFAFHGPTARLELLLPELVLGCAGFAAFRWTPRVDRRLPDLRSYLTLLAGAVLAAAPASILTVALYFPAFTWSASAVWFAAIVASIALVAPVLLLLCPRGSLEVARAAAERGGARARPPARRARGWIVRQLLGSPVPAPRADGGAVASAIAVVLAAVLAIHLSVYSAGPGSPFTQWLLLLFSLPILFASYRGGLRGGLLAAAAVGVSLLVSGRATAADLDWHFSTVELQGGVLLFSLFGAFAGATRDRERNLTRQLERSNRSLRQDLERVLAALRSAMEAKDQYTEGHLRRVCEFAVEVGRRLKLRPHELELLEIASLLHDVGKIGIADSVLRKPGPLDERERQLMQRHPAIGARILENVDGLNEAADMVRHHQERFDGRITGEFPGYPTASPGARFRSARGSSPWSTHSTR